MKKIILIIFLFALIIKGNTAFAQKETFSQKEKHRDREDVEVRAEKLFDEYNKVLNLKEDQKAKVKKVFMQQEQQREFDMDDYGKQNKKLKTEETNAKMAAVERQKETDKKLKKILTEEQFQKFVEHRKQTQNKIIKGK